MWHIYKHTWYKRNIYKYLLKSENQQHRLKPGYGSKMKPEHAPSITEVPPFLQANLAIGHLISHDLLIGGLYLSSYRIHAVLFIAATAARDQFVRI